MHETCTLSKPSEATRAMRRDAYVYVFYFGARAEGRARG